MLPRRSSLVWVLLASTLAGGMGGLVTSRLWPQSADTQPRHAQSSVGREQVPSLVVGRSDLESVVTLDATAIPAPQFAITSAARGSFRRERALAPGARVRAGQTVGWQGTTQIKSPVDAILVRWEAPGEVELPKNTPLAYLKYVGFALKARVPQELLYRMYSGPQNAKGQVSNGPGPFNCQLLGASPEPGADGSISPQVLCAVPDSTDVYEGSAAVVAVATAQRTNVVSIPVGAVAGDALRGTVLKVVHGKVVEASVDLGISDGVNVEITKGLSVGDQILAVGPDLKPTGG